MPQLKKFIFNLETAIVKNKNDLVLLSDEDIQRNFIGRGFGPVGSYIDIFSKENGSKGHAYSFPYEFHSRSQIYSLPYQFSQFLFLSIVLLKKFKPYVWRIYVPLNMNFFKSSFKAFLF